MADYEYVPPRMMPRDLEGIVEMALDASQPLGILRCQKCGRTRRLATSPHIPGVMIAICDPCRIEHLTRHPDLSDDVPYIRHWDRTDQGYEAYWEAHRQMTERTEAG